ncbi:MAG TPA: 4-hydroxyphenylacetate 3-hydroxylase N-terminal domain-containing protein [Chloroflexota bacterium]|nr:4-hydroxyphenylacetate 3-hydroxylase N-terminal domain-containing protein [Chloroflexota bacterium]
MRTGQQYRESLRDGRTVYVYGERVPDVASHPAFAGIVDTVAGLYDFAADPANGMIHHNPDVGTDGNKTFMIPRGPDDLRQRREAIAAWARRTNGLVGRGPDHLGSVLAGIASAPSVLARGRPEFGENITRFYQRLVADDLYVTYVIIPPQVDRTQSAAGQEDAFTQVGVVREQDGGIVVRGAQMLGTAAPISNWLFVSCIVPLRPGDEDYANTFLVPIDAPGLKFYARPPYAVGRPSTFDYPLSTRFDETDSLVVFDDVFVPWENVLVCRNLELLRAQYFETASHVLGNNQAQIRLAVKLQFIAGLSRKIAATTRVDAFPAVQERLGELASLAAMVEGMALASEAAATVDKFGVLRPDPRFLYGAMGLQAELYPRALHLLRELAGGGVIQVPSSYKELLAPETAPDVRRYVRSPGVPAEERIKLYKLAWDMVGTEFAGRHEQYEMFYAGAPYVAKGYAYRNYRYEEAVALVDAFLESYGLDDTADGAAPGAPR